MSLGSSPSIRSLTCLSEAQTARLETADVPCDFAPARYAFVGVHFNVYVFSVANATIVGGVEIWGGC